MSWIFAQLARLRRTPVERAFVCVLVLHIFALFCFLPFGQPVIAAPVAAPPAGTEAGPTCGPPGEAPDVEAPKATVTEADSVLEIKAGGGLQRVFGTRHQADQDLFEHGAANSSLFQGLRACASLPAANARQVYLAPLRSYQLRAPPAGA